jgi:hypothetical protein
VPRETERSEDAATRETEGGHAEPWATGQLARTIFVAMANTGPHTYSGMLAGVFQTRRKFLDFRQDNPYRGWFPPRGTNVRHMGESAKRVTIEVRQGHDTTCTNC